MPCFQQKKCVSLKGLILLYLLFAAFNLSAETEARPFTPTDFNFTLDAGWKASVPVYDQTNKREISIREPFINFGGFFAVDNTSFFHLRLGINTSIYPVHEYSSEPSNNESPFALFLLGAGDKIIQLGLNADIHYWNQFDKNLYLIGGYSYGINSSNIELLHRHFATTFINEHALFLGMGTHVSEGLFTSLGLNYNIQMFKNVPIHNMELIINIGLIF